MQTINTAILVLFFHVGPMGEGNSNAVTSIPMKDVATCQREAPKTRNMVSGTVKKVEWLCLNNN